MVITMSLFQFGEPYVLHTKMEGRCCYLLHIVVL